jgi:competence protein ComEA
MEVSMNKLFAALAVVAQIAFAGAALAAVNINTASKDELIALPGIGPAKAQAIVDYRKANGPFKTVDDLKSVKGIGAKRLEKLRPELSVGSSPARVAAAPVGAGAGSGAAKATGPAAKGEVRVAAEGKPAK